MTSSVTDFSLRPLARAIALATATTPALAAAQMAEEEQKAGALEEVIVTATKRAANMQDLPMSIEVFNAEQIDKMGLVNMAELIKAIPSLSTVTTSPGRNEVVFRGVSTGSGEWRTDSGSAVYFGDIPMTSATQAVDPRSVSNAFASRPRTASRPPSMENSGRATHSGLKGSPRWAISSRRPRKACMLGPKSRGPETKAMWSRPSSCRCRTATRPAISLSAST